jgi:hypothetical protein
VCFFPSINTDPTAHLLSDLPIRRQITVNDLPVGRSVEETIRLIEAFQFSVRSSTIHPSCYVSRHSLPICRTSTVRSALPAGRLVPKPSKPILKAPLNTSPPQVLAKFLPTSVPVRSKPTFCRISLFSISRLIRLALESRTLRY